MLSEILANRVWVSVCVWAILYIGDYAFTIIGAKLYRNSARKYLTFEVGYELNPVFKKDIAGFRYFSPRFILFLFITSILILIIWRLSRPFPQLFSFLIGALLLVEVSIHIRHLRNIALFRLFSQDGAVDGHISYAAWLSYRVSALELFSFAGFYLIIFFLTDNLFFLGGMAACTATSLKHLWLSRRKAASRLKKTRDTAEGIDGAANQDVVQDKEDR